MPKAPHSSQAQPDVEQTGKHLRSKSGCHNCRLRGKRCDNRPDADSQCETCRRFRMECLGGFEQQRPSNIKKNAARLLDAMREHVRWLGAQRGGTSKRLNRAYENPADAPFLVLRNILSTTPPSQFADTSESSNSSQSEIEDFDDAETLVSPAGRVLESTIAPFHSLIDPILLANSRGAASNIQLLTEMALSFWLQSISIPPSVASDDTMTQYKAVVYPLQYPLSMPEERNITFNLIDAPGAAQDSARLLTRVFYHHDKPTLKERLHPLHEPLFDSIISKGTSDEDKASAALIQVSIILFEGGTGNWVKYINTSYHFLWSTIQSPLTSTVIPHITKAIRLDILGAITTLEEPMCLDMIRYFLQPESDIKMLESSMACENVVVWALAEASALAKWKRNQTELAMSHLINQGLSLEIAIGSHEEWRGCAIADQQRVHIAAIFRQAAILYIRSIVWENNPSVFEIAEPVRHLYLTFRGIESNNDVATFNCIIRSTVFPLFLAASLAREEEHFDYFSGLLARQNGPGNCRPAEKMLRELRPLPLSVDTPVFWRERLNEEQMLLV